MAVERLLQASTTKKYESKLFCKPNAGVSFRRGYTKHVSTARTSQPSSASTTTSLCTEELGGEREKRDRKQVDLTTIADLADVKTDAEICHLTSDSDHGVDLTAAREINDAEPSITNNITKQHQRRSDQDAYRYS